MTDLTELLADEGPVAREVEIGGKKATVHFKRISAGEQEEILRGQKVQQTMGDKAVIELDLSENERQRHLLVLYCVCKPDGSRYFKGVAEVKKLDSRKVRVLAEHAQAVNSEGDDAGKA